MAGNNTTSFCSPLIFIGFAFACLYGIRTTGIRRTFPAIRSFLFAETGQYPSRNAHIGHTADMDAQVEPSRHTQWDTKLHT